LALSIVSSKHLNTSIQPFDAMPKEKKSDEKKEIGITVKKADDMPEWFEQVCIKSGLAEFHDVKVTFVIKPHGYALWENIQEYFNREIVKKNKVQNAYFPMFIPKSLLTKESEHFAGFTPEVAWVTKGGASDLAEPLAIRPTSETIMYAMYSKWVQSYRDLPLLLNQWNNAVRWEKRTYFFLRTTEFLWQEAHTVHATHEEAWTMVLNGLEAYRDLVENYLAIPVIKGRKSSNETFAGASLTTTIEAMMPDGKALQAGTSHDLGQNFSKKDAFDIAFQTENGGTDYAWQTSFGLSTRIIGALIMTHGDDDGLVLPPKIAPTQVAIIPTEDNEEIHKACIELLENLKKVNIRTTMISGKDHRFGWRLNEAEIQGIPLTLVIGEQEVSKKIITANIALFKPFFAIFPIHGSSKACLAC